MSIPESIRAKLGELGPFYTFLSVLGSLITIGGFVAWLFDRLPEDPLTTLSIGAAIFNTLVTLVIINWAITKKNESNIAKVESGAKKSSYISKGWQNPSKETCSETEIDKWVGLCAKLTKKLGECDKEKINQGAFLATTISQKDVRSQMDSLATFLLPTSQEDSVYNEALNKLNEYNAKKRT